MEHMGKYDQMGIQPQQRVHIERSKQVVSQFSTALLGKLTGLVGEWFASFVFLE